ncbi:MAG: alpha/beta hydrolase fold domain-containing protein [Rhodobacteraceae bacterium]|nr:alpha/beta hydrolase fold domain-containing protein [Paracoccaceae bacterium]
MSIRLALTNFLLRNIERRALARIKEPVKIRRRMELQTRLFFRPKRGTPITREALAHGQSSVSALKISNGNQGVLLYLHGGAYIFGSAKTHRRFAAKLAADNALTAYSVDYRLAPEHPFPAAIDDALTAYQALLGRGVKNITIAGDSAGGGLALALLHIILAKGFPKPRAVVAFSPLTDQTMQSQSLKDNAKSEAMLPAERMGEVRDMYITADFKNPLASPLFGDFKNAPPVFLCVGTTEILRDDTLAMAAKLRAQNVPVTLEILENAPHVWPFFHGRLPEADATLKKVQTFLSQPTL